MFKLPKEQLLKLEEFKKQIDPLYEIRWFIDRMPFFKSFVHNLFLSIESGKYLSDGFGPVINFEKMVSDGYGALEAHEKDRIIVLIEQRGQREAYRILHLLFLIMIHAQSLPIKVEVKPNGWELDKEYLEIKRSMWKRKQQH